MINIELDIETHTTRTIRAELTHDQIEEIIREWAIGTGKFSTALDVDLYAGQVVSASLVERSRSDDI